MNFVRTCVHNFEIFVQKMTYMSHAYFQFSKMMGITVTCVFSATPKTQEVSNTMHYIFYFLVFKISLLN